MTKQNCLALNTDTHVESQQTVNKIKQKYILTYLLNICIIILIYAGMLVNKSTVPASKESQFRSSFNNLCTVI